MNPDNQYFGYYTPHPFYPSQQPYHGHVPSNNNQQFIGQWPQSAYNAHHSAFNAHQFNGIILI
jgi:hypothetical protein